MFWSWPSVPCAIFVLLDEKIPSLVLLLNFFETFFSTWVSFFPFPMSGKFLVSLLLSFLLFIYWDKVSHNPSRLWIVYAAEDNLEVGLQVSATPLCAALGTKPLKPCACPASSLPTKPYPQSCFAFGSRESLANSHCVRHNIEWSLFSMLGTSGFVPQRSSQVLLFHVTGMRILKWSEVGDGGRADILLS